MGGKYEAAAPFVKVWSRDHDYQSPYSSSKSDAEKARRLLQEGEPVPAKEEGV